MTETSIIVFAEGREDQLASCLWSIETFTVKDEYELFVVGRGLQFNDEQLQKINYIESKGNPISAVNEAICHSKGKDIAFLYGDAMVTSHWLPRLKKVLYSSERCGAVGPLARKSSHFQQISEAEAKEYSNIREMALAAAEIAVHNRGKVSHTLFLDAICLLLKRQAIDDMGFLPEEYQTPAKAFMDYTVNMIKCGWECLIAREVYVHNAISALDGIPQTEDDVFTQRQGFTASYSLGFRGDILELAKIQEKPGLSVLDIGCACGGTLMKIMDADPSAERYGIEMSPGAAAVAEHFGKVFQEDMLKLDMPELAAKFDYIFMGDVLEHIVDTDAALSKVYGWLKRGGRLIVSVPNVANISIITGLLMGRWHYQNSGILDRTHMRFFTYNEMKEHLERHGFSVRYDCYSHVTYGYPMTDLMRALVELPFFKVDPRDLEAFQWIFVVEK